MDPENTELVETNDENSSEAKNRDLNEETGKVESPDSSLNLSITPPCLDKSPDEKKAKNSNEGRNSDSSISEHLSSGAESIENDRSIQEIEISHLPSFSSVLINIPAEELSLSKEEKPPSLDSSFRSESSIISLNGLDKFALQLDVRKILEDILNSEIFKSDELNVDPEDQSFNLFFNMDLDDEDVINRKSSDAQKANVEAVEKENFRKNSKDVSLQMKELEELVLEKDNTIAALLSEIDSYREMMSGPSTLSLGTSTTEYKQFHEECQSKLVEYHSAVVLKDGLIRELTESLQQSIANREELTAQVDMFKNDVIQLQKQLEEMHDNVKKQNILSYMSKSSSKEDVSDIVNKSLDGTLFDEECSKLEETMNSIRQVNLLNNLKVSMGNYLKLKIEENEKAQELKIAQLKDELQAEKGVHADETGKLQEIISSLKSAIEDHENIRREMEDKHSREMEELRTYFERKCADLEKNYSEEIFSQHSRKMSASSSVSEELPADLLMRTRPGPGGDICEPYPVDLRKRNLRNLSKNDFKTLKDDVNNLNSIFQSYDLDEISEEKFQLLKDDVASFDVKNLFKVELEAVRIELQNKFHAELEILREDYENKIDLFNLDHERKLRKLEAKYAEEVEAVREDLEHNRPTVYDPSAIQERLAASDYDDNEDWPVELLGLKNKFAQKYETELNNLRKEHDREIAKIKEEYARQEPSGSNQNADLNERSNHKKQISLLKNLLRELLRYFTECEDELNNTLIDELLRQGFDKNSIDLNDSSTTTSSKSDINIKRVHFAPNISDLFSILDSSSVSEGDSIDLSADLKTELGQCLEKLKSEANAILALTSHLPKKESEVDRSANTSLDDELVKKLMEEKHLRRDLSEELIEAKALITSLEKERVLVENQLEQVVDKFNVTQRELEIARNKIAEFIDKEIVSEGYGENGIYRTEERGVALLHFSELKEKARNVISGTSCCDQDLLQIVEELCRIGDEIIEDCAKEKQDLEQQIDVADKKYKRTCKFLEEQAADREQERDEAQREINRLQDQLKDKERDKISRQRMSDEQRGIKTGHGSFCSTCIHDVEQLEEQIRDLVLQLQDRDAKFKELETDRKEAVDKIYLLRDIIRDLELQVKTKTEKEQELNAVIDELESLLAQQTGQESSQQIDSSRFVSDVQELKNHIVQLESEVQKLRIGQELVGNESVIKQVKNQLKEFEITLDKRTKDLEELHSAISTNCSTPSEDMSVRDVVRPQTPTSAALLECEVPLQQLARLKEKLIKHSRAEDAAMKRIRDLEMQIFTLKNNVEELQVEKDILKKENSEQLVQISSLQIRLDDQRIRAEHIEKQTNTSLESRIYDLQKEISELHERLLSRDQTINQLTVAVEETKQRLAEKELELNAGAEDDLIIAMQKEIEHLRNQNEFLHKKINSGAEIIPNLVENIISDKNSDIENLKSKLCSVEKQLEFYYSLNLDSDQLKALSALKNSGTSIAEVLSIFDFSEPEAVRREAPEQESIINLRQILKNKTVDDTSYSEETFPEISSIEKVTQSAHMNTPASTPRAILSDVSSSSKKVRFQTRPMHKKRAQSTLKESQIGDTPADVQDSPEVIIEILRKELAMKDEVIEECNRRIETLSTLESHFEQLRLKLDEVTKQYEGELETYRENESSLRITLAEKKLHLEEKERELEVYKKDCTRKDEMYIHLAKENKNLLKQIALMEEQLVEHKNFDDILDNKNKIIQDLEQQLATAQVDPALEERLTNLQNIVDRFKEEISHKNQELENTKIVNKNLEEINKVEKENSRKLLKEIENSKTQISMLAEEAVSLKNTNHKYAQIEEVLRAEQHKMEQLQREIKEYKGQNEKLRKQMSAMEAEHQQWKEEKFEMARAIDDLRHSIEETEKLLQDEKDSNQKLVKEIDNKKVQIQSLLKEDTVEDDAKDRKIYTLETQLRALKARDEENSKKVEDLEKKVKLQNDSLIDRDCEIEILREDQKKYEEDVIKLEEQVAQIRSSSPKTSRRSSGSKQKSLRPAELREKVKMLQNEVDHMQELITEKDKIIQQFAEDSKNLHISLATIQNKIQETGNIVDLAKKLREEQRRNADLVEQIQYLKMQLLNSNQMAASIDDITGQVKRELDYSAHLDACIMNAVGEHSLNSFSDIIDIETARITLQSLQSRYDCLSGKYDNVLKTCENLKRQLENEKSTLNRVQYEDGCLIEELRIHLDKASQNEAIFEQMLKSERDRTHSLTLQIRQLREQLAIVSSKSESTDYKKLPDIEVKENTRLRTKIEELNKEIVALALQNKTLLSANEELQQSLCQTTQLLDIKGKEAAQLESRADDLSQKVIQLKNQVMEYLQDLTKKNKEVEASRTSMIELQEDLLEMKIKYDQLNERLKMRKPLIEKPSAEELTNSSAPEKLLKTIEEVRSTVRNSKSTMELLFKISSEKNQLQDKISAMERELAIMEFESPASRSNFLFAKTLRAESYRKALIWQKRYLISLLKTYQESPLIKGIVLTSYESKYSRPVKMRGLRKLRGAVYCVISVIRMKYLVQRWRSGKRVVQQVNSMHYARQSTLCNAATRASTESVFRPTALFQVGKTPSQQNVATTPISLAKSKSGGAVGGRTRTLPSESSRSLFTGDIQASRSAFDLSWSGETPPSKLHNDNRTRSRTEVNQAPDMLSKYIQRYSQIEDKLESIIRANSVGT